ncbi:MAG: hypothetical protein R2713_23255 [Ilumatobacteraceae bacterium]
MCVKQIPDPATPGALDPGTKTLKRDGKLILDESDSYGVEMALQLVDAGGGEVKHRVDGSERRGERDAHRTRDGCGQGRARERPGPAGQRRASPPPRCWPPPSASSAAPIW